MHAFMHILFAFEYRNCRSQDNWTSNKAKMKDRLIVDLSR